ncbi:helix-turn-helix domain-containing protein [Paenibacillus amylolyticus]|uniref:helix-turn-helix domain-containing protein n=1 Tax=Paenibacillus amylolyticus TaxID=1451 RepID=UPI003D99CFDD
MIGLEFIVKVYNGTYKKLAEKLGIASPTIMGWLSKKRPIPQSKLEALSKMFGIDEVYFQKELSEVEKIQIEINYLNRLSKRDSVQVPIQIIDEEGIKHEVFEMFDPHEQVIRAMHEELAIQKLILRLRGVLYNESMTSEFTLTSHFNLVSSLCDFLEKDIYYENTNNGITVEDNSAEVKAIETLLYIFENKNRLAFGIPSENSFTLELEELLYKHKLLPPGHVLGFKEDPFFKDVE